MCCSSAVAEFHPSKLFSNSKSQLVSSQSSEKEPETQRKQTNKKIYKLICSLLMVFHFFVISLPALMKNESPRITRINQSISREFILSDESFSTIEPDSTLLFSLNQILIATFLPNGYPHSVRPEYLEYQMWDSLQGLSSYLRSVITTRSVLLGAGVGVEGADAMSAAMAWVLKDGVGMIGSLIFAFHFSNQFEINCKEWRLFADFLNNVALTIDLFSSFFPPRYYMLLISLSSLFKSLCGLIAGATKSSISSHFAVRGHLADVTAKEGTQETAVALTGIFLGLLCAHLVGTDSFSTVTMFVLFLVVHQWANYRLVRVLALDTLNPARATLLLRLLSNDTPSLLQSNPLPPRFPSPSDVSSLSSLLLPLHCTLLGPRLAPSLSSAISALQRARLHLPSSISTSSPPPSLPSLLSQLIRFWTASTPSTLSTASTPIPSISLTRPQFFLSPDPFGRANVYFLSSPDTGEGKEGGREGGKEGGRSEQHTSTKGGSDPSVDISSFFLSLLLQDRWETAIRRERERNRMGRKKKKEEEGEGENDYNDDREFSTLPRPPPPRPLFFLSLLLHISVYCVFSICSLFFPSSSLLSMYTSLSYSLHFPLLPSPLPLPPSELALLLPRLPPSDSILPSSILPSSSLDPSSDPFSLQSLLLALHNILSPSLSPSLSAYPSPSPSTSLCLGPSLLLSLGESGWNVNDASKLPKGELRVRVESELQAENASQLVHVPDHTSPSSSPSPSPSSRRDLKLD